MQMTLDILAEPCQAHEPLRETTPTTVSASGCDWEHDVSDPLKEIVEDDRFAANPISHRDPTGLRDPDKSGGINGVHDQHPYGYMGYGSSCDIGGADITDALKILMRQVRQEWQRLALQRT